MAVTRAVLLDIEGTTTDIRFVHDVLFPLSRRELPGYVASRWGTPEVQGARAAVAQDEGEPPALVTPEALTAALLRWIAEDRKETSLKELQGEIWRAAYASGALVSHVYPDVEPALRRWRAAGLTLAIFSSGSVEAQRLLFRHTAGGDLTPYFTAYFDTTTGPKRDPAAYGRIAAALGSPPGEVLFLSDILAELDAARAAGMQTVHVVREGAPALQGGHPAAASFDEIRVTEAGR